MFHNMLVRVVPLQHFNFSPCAYYERILTALEVSFKLGPTRSYMEKSKAFWLRSYLQFSWGRVYFYMGAKVLEWMKKVVFDFEEQPV